MSLIAYYPLGDCSANTVVADLSGNGHVGTAARNTVLSHAEGRFADRFALDFNGATDLVDGGSDFVGAAACTLAAWIFLDSYGEGSPGSGRIVDHGKLLFYVFYNNNCISLSSNGGTTTVVSAASAVSTGAWYHVAATRTAAGAANLYVNGQLSGGGNRNSGTPAAGTTNVVLGNRAAGDRAFDGRMCEVRIYDSVLSAAEILALYQWRPSSIFTPILQPVLAV